MSERPSIEEAWAAVFEILPTGWTVVHSVEHPDVGYWVAYARDPFHDKRKPTPPFVDVICQTQPVELVELERCIREGACRPGAAVTSFEPAT